MSKRIKISTVVMALLLTGLWIGLLAVQAASSVTGVSVSYNPPAVSTASNVCELPQISMNLTISGTFDADDGSGLDAYAVRLIDGRNASLWPDPAAAINFAYSEDGGRMDIRLNAAPTGSTSITWTDNVYHPTANPVRVEVYEVMNYVPAGLESAGTVGNLLFSSTFDAPCEGAGRPPDDRVADDLAAPVVVYTYTRAENADVAIEVYRIQEGRGQQALVVSQDALAAIPSTPANATTIAATEGGIAVSRLPEGTCQVTAPQANGPLYVLAFDCPDVEGAATGQVGIPRGGSAPEGSAVPPAIVPGVSVVVETPGDLEDIAVRVWRVDSNNLGRLALSVSFAQLNAVPQNPAENTAIAGTSSGNIVLYRLRGGECQVNATQQGTNEPYVFIVCK